MVAGDCGTDSTGGAKAAGKDIPPLFVSLSPNAQLPSKDYLRLVALSNPDTPKIGGCSPSAGPLMNKAAQGPRDGNDNILTYTNSKERNPQRHEFALHVRGARYCRLLETMLDTSDLQLDSPRHNGKGTAPDSGLSVSMSPVVLPQATEKGCLALFAYLELITKRVPSMLSKPLRAPLEELVQPWELEFLLHNCMYDDVRSCIERATNDNSWEKENKTPSSDKRQAHYVVILEKAPQSLDLLLEVAMLSDFLLIESLRQLTCAFIASLACNASSEEELLRLSGLERPMTEDELEPLYLQFPFLRPDNNVEP
uniref:SKP1 component dimerisation domain-containing protein n=1 Tax=Trypanosoma congolense (strain IL3000) TaxID=1068625 RepID=G0UYH0_TRYCI|nr:conserved hypothetical protein [Trypanosoma congolense IL3000]